MEVKKKKFKVTKYLSGINAGFVVLVLILSCIVAIFTGGDKTKFTLLSVYVCIVLLLIYNFVLIKACRKNLNDIKKELLYINWPVRIASFMILLGFIFIASFITLYAINPDAAKIALAFTFFMSVISMLFPAILFLVVIYFLFPFIIIPGYTIKNIKDKSRENALKIIFILLLLFGLYSLCSDIYNRNTFSSKDTFLVDHINTEYQTNYLKISPEVSAYAKKLMSRDSVKLPLLYTADSYEFKNYDDAERFCASMNGRLPNYLEIYHIVFNKFETFGNKYYWTSDIDGNKNLLLHFNNMSYIVEKLPENVKPEVYCVAEADSTYKEGSKTYFHRNIRKEARDTVNAFSKKPFNFENLKDIAGMNTESSKQEKFGLENEINNDKKHISFSVKEVPADLFNKLIVKGYKYDPSAKLLPEFEVNDAGLKKRLNLDPDKKQIRLCYFPFLEYEGMTIEEEKQVWSQSFCSPAFELINSVPAVKGRYEKDAYCWAQGGRVPNIPELFGILKSLNINPQGNKYWTGSYVQDNRTNAKNPVYVYMQDSRIVKVSATSTMQAESANLFCIKNSKKPSRVISNYSSRFSDAKTEVYAGKYCSSCTLYDVPDVILH